jgi:hypothetical protein
MRNHSPGRVAAVHRRRRLRARAPIRRSGRAGWRHRIGVVETPDRRWDGVAACPRAARPGVAEGSRRWGRERADRRRPAPRTGSHRSEWTAVAERTTSVGRRCHRPRRNPAGNGRRGTAELGRPTWPRPAVRRRTAPRTSYAPPPSRSAGSAVDSAVAAAPSAPGSDRGHRPARLARVATVPNRTGRGPHSESRCPLDDLPPLRLPSLDLGVVVGANRAASRERVTTSPRSTERVGRGGGHARARSRRGGRFLGPPGTRRRRAGTSTRARRRRSGGRTTAPAW